MLAHQCAEAGMPCLHEGNQGLGPRGLGITHVAMCQYSCRSSLFLKP